MDTRYVYPKDIRNIEGEIGDRPVIPTRIIIYDGGTGILSSFNDLVAAVRELQYILIETQTRLDALEPKEN